MPKICYVERRFSSESQRIVDRANAIIFEYERQGFDLTLRQLYYQFVSRDLLPNTPESYKRLGSIINDARLAGRVDWHRIEDRTRGVEAITSWSSPSSIIDACARQFKIDLWESQPYYPEVWIEKEALAGVFEGVCRELRLPYLSCRGYTSQSEMWRAAQRLEQASNRGKQPIIFHFGDHDPSGIDMSRDIQDRLWMFMGGTDFHRLALNMDQVETYQPPPNPAKITDSRSNVYIARFGDESWELDALNPTILAGLVRTAVGSIIDQSAWDAAKEEEDRYRQQIGLVSHNWNNVVTQLENGGN